jgi:SAM-dependent methyltransferase
MTGYYREKLAADRLRQVYEIAPPRVKQYLEAEISYVLDQICPGDCVLELGCGYGRVLERLAMKAQQVVGIDTSLPSLRLAGKLLADTPDIGLACMDAVTLGLADHSFDLVVCIQNGISAFHVDPRALVVEALRITRSGGRILFSTYSRNFWDERLRWFRLQTQHGLLGEIDNEKTRDGIIVCRDGFTAVTFDPEEFHSLTRDLGVSARLFEVDKSSLFCEILLR